MVWGASFVATRIALESLTPFGLLAVRLWIGAGLLAVLLATRAAGVARGSGLLPGRRDWGACAVLGVVLALHLFLQAYGLNPVWRQHTSAVHTGWIIGFIPVTVALGAQLLGQQRIRPLGWIGVGVGTTGILVVVLSSLHRGSGGDIRGDLLQVGSCLTWTVYTLVATRPVARSGALRVTMLSMALAALLNTIPAVDGGALHLQSGFLHASLTPRSVLATAFLGPICSGLAYYLWFAAQREHGPARLNALIYAEPVVALLTGWLLLGEPILPETAVGGVCVLVGAWLVARGTARPVVQPAPGTVKTS